MDNLFSCVDNDIDGEGVIDNCRWLYSSTSNNRAPGFLSFASSNGFDRWANSRIIDISTISWEVTDPNFEKFITGIVNLFNA